MKKKSLLEIANMTNEEVIDYYKTRQMLNEDIEDSEEEFLGIMTEEEVIEKYHLIPEAKAREIIDSKYHISEYSVKNRQ